MEYPTREGISVPVWEISLPRSRYGDKKKFKNVHHNEWTESAMAKLAVTQALRDLERHQFELPMDVHEWLHKKYDPPALPTEEQAAREVIDAYDKGEKFNIRCDGIYTKFDIPKPLVDEFVAKYSLIKIIDMSRNTQ